MSPERIPLSKIIAYGFGIFGWSISINIISVMLLYLYLPPNNSGMINLVPQVIVFGIFNIIALVTASGRLLDAVVDPFIAGWSDRSRHPKGRRIPLMAIAIIPMCFFVIMMFFPPYESAANKLNLVWLAVFQLGYYFFFGLYVIPYNALLAELGHYPNGKMHISTAQSVGFILGVVFSSSTPAVGNLLKDVLPAISVLKSNQYAIIILNIVGAICMLVPVIFIEEKRYVKPAIVTESVLESLKTALRNRNFRIFAVADASFYMSVAIITGGLLYYVKAMLMMPEAIGFFLMAVMVLLSLMIYPLVNIVAGKFSKKKMIIGAFSFLVLIFTGIYWLGRYPCSPVMQGVLLMIGFGIPNGFLNILPPTVVADIAEADTMATKQNKEGMYFGMRALFQKFGQTMGIMIFAMLTLYGKDPGHDLGLRLSGIAGAVLCLTAALVYTGYDEGFPAAKK
jgi:GPH family glycoside/pentoside/hexuronide:cation symporter